MTDQHSSLVDPHLVRYGLSRAIQVNSEEFRAKNPRIQLDLDLVEDEGLLSEDDCLALYQVYLDSLARARLAQAGRIWIHYYPLHQQMALEIKDDGPAAAEGFDPARMSECVQEVGGQLTLSPRPEQGTIVKAVLPLD